MRSCRAGRYSFSHRLRTLSRHFLRYLYVLALGLRCMALMLAEVSSATNALLIWSLRDLYRSGPAKSTPVTVNGSVNFIRKVGKADVGGAFRSLTRYLLQWLQLCLTLLTRDRSFGTQVFCLTLLIVAATPPCNVCTWQSMIRLTKVDFRGMKIRVYPLTHPWHLVSLASSLASSKLVAMSPVLWAICTHTPSASDISGLIIGPFYPDFLRLFIKKNSNGPLYAAASSKRTLSAALLPSSSLCLG